MVEGKTLHPKGWRNDLGPIVLSLVRDDHKQPQYFIAVLEDITEKICAERALRDAEHRLCWRRMVRTSGFGIVTCERISSQYGEVRPASRSTA